MKWNFADFGKEDEPCRNIPYKVTANKNSTQIKAEQIGVITDNRQVQNYNMLTCGTTSQRVLKQNRFQHYIYLIYNEKANLK